MGNTLFGDKTYNSVECKKNEEKFYLEIEIDTFDISNITHKLNELKNITLNKYIKKIIQILNKFLKNDGEIILSQFDGYLFKIHDILPLLKITNKNALLNKQTYLTDTHVYCYKICYLS